MSDVVDALRLAKERAVESENDEDLARFRDAEKQAMAQEHYLRVLADTRIAYREARKTNALPDIKPNAWLTGFNRGAAWALDIINEALGEEDGSAV